MSIDGKELKVGFAAAGLAASVLLTSFTATAAQAEEVTIKYGDRSDVKKMERYLKRAAKKGLEVNFEGGLGNTDCFALLNVAGQEIVRVGADDARMIVSFAKDITSGEVINQTTLSVASAGCPVEAYTQNITTKYTLWFGDQVDEWDLEGAVDVIKENVTDDIAVMSGFDIPECVALFDKNGALLDIFSGNDVIGSIGANIQVRERGDVPGESLSGNCVVHD